MLDKEELKREFQRIYQSAKMQLDANQRLRLGAWLVLVIVLMQPVWWISAYRTSLLSELAQNLEKEAKIARIAKENEWLARAVDSKELAAQLYARVAKINSLGAAQATTQNWLSDYASQAQLEGVRIEVEAPIAQENIPGVYRVAAKIDAVFLERNAVSFFAMLEKHPSFLVVERADLGQGRQARITLFVIAYFEISAPRS